MNTQFAAAMRRASDHTRAQNLVEATRLIQEALNGRTPPDGGSRTEEQRSETLALPQPKIRGASGASRPAGAKTRETLAATLSERLAGLRPNVSGGCVPCMGPEAARPDSGAPHAAGAQFLTRSFSCAAGSRSYKLYVPASAPDRPRGLIVMLHGCTQNPDDFATGSGMNAVAEARGFAVAYPSQTRSDNASSCWNWFDPKHQRRGSGEPAIIAGLTREIVAEFGIDPAQVFVAGLSAGGAMAAVMSETYPDLYVGVGVHSGLPTNAASDVASAFAVMRGQGGAAPGRSGSRPAARTIVFQGRADRTVHPSNADRIVREATPDAASITTRQVAGRSGRRGYTRTVVADPSGAVIVEHWLVDDAGHAWSGGRSGGSYVDPAGPDASAEMMRFFLGEQESAAQPA